MTKIATKGSGIVAALFLFLFNTFFAIGWLGMTWLYPAEIVPLRIRAPANALSTSANWAFNFMGRDYPFIARCRARHADEISSGYDYAGGIFVYRISDLYHLCRNVSPGFLYFP